MALNRALSWYQHKISAYDKQVWEETVEQRIIHGLTHVPKKSGKLKLEYIDLDLVRGSSFPKAKPKHGLVYISQICLIRLLFLPFYRQWWIRQTSARIFKLLLLLYFFQILNVTIYLSRPTLLSVEVVNNANVQNSTTTTETQEPSPTDVTAEEVLVPGIMMCILSFLLSQIGSTYTGSNKSPFKPRNKVRIKRAKRKLSRRIGNVPSDSKSSLDNVEQPLQDPVKASEIKSGLNRRSLSEERKSPRIKFPQRSSSLQLESNHTLMPHLASKAPLAPKNDQASVNIVKRNSWQNFFTWSSRFVGSKRTLNEDEGFDSFHGNNSSSSDCDTEDKSKKIHQQQSDTVTPSEEIIVEDAAHQKQATDETCTLETSANFKNIVGDTSRLEEIADGVNDQPLLRRRRNLPIISLKLIPPEDNNGYVIQSESETEPARRNPKSVTILSTQRRGSNAMFAGESSYQSSCESDGDGHSSLASPSYKLSEPSTPLDWTGVTTNSEECSYSSESRSESEDQESNRFPNVGDFSWSDELTFAWDCHGGTSTASSSDKISCTLWEGFEVKKADLSVLDVAASIIAKVDVMPESTDYLYGGLVMAALFALLPILYRINGAVGNAILTCMRAETIPKIMENIILVCDTLLGSSKWEKLVVITAALERFAMAAFFLFLLAVAERTFKQRFLYAKLFSHITSSRRARNSDLPHFRLNKVRNIKTWLSVRSYLKKRGPQRSVDCIVSTAFIVTLCLVSFLCTELLKESQYLHQSLYNLEVLCWCLVLGVFLLRFMTLGSKINKKYRNLSVLITEQINLYLQMEQKPHKKEELMLANNVLKLAADLLKELESPFKISGLSANPYLYNLTKVVVLSALSGVLSEMLGFKLKLHKIKIR